MNGIFGYETLELTNVASTNAGIVGGATTLDLLRPPYTLRSADVDLGLSARRPGTLGGNGLYANVPITIPLTISGATPALVYAALATLLALLEETQRWVMNEWVGGVRLRGKLVGSTFLQPSECAVLRPPDADASAELPTVYQPPAGGPPGPYAMDVDVKLVRRGQWLQPQETQAAAGAVSGTLQTVAFPGTGQRIASPLRLAWHSNTDPLDGLGTGTADNQAAFVWAADSTLANGGAIFPAASKIRILEGEGFTLGGVFASVGDAANQARGGSVLRYTPAVANTFSTTLYVAGSFGGAFLGARIMVYGVARKNTLATADYQAQLIGYQSGNTAPFANAIQPLTLPDLRPNVVCLGTILAPGGIALLGLSLSASAVGGSLDLDYLVLVNVDDPTASAVTYSLNGILLSAGNTICADPRPLTDPTGIIGAGSATGRVFLPYQGPLGDPWLAAQGTGVCGVLMQPNDAYWRAYNPGGPNLISWVMTAIRWPSGLVLP